MITHLQKEQLVKFARKLITNHLTRGSGGNISIIDRQSETIAITPSGMDYFEMSPADIVMCDTQGRVTHGRCSPSSEMAFHLQLYARRPDIGSVVHTHSVYATTLACLQLEIPAVHYLVGFSGHKVPLAPYATFGTPELARSVTETIGSFNAVLLAHHGLVAVGRDLPAAFAVAEEIEFVAQVYYQAIAVGEPETLSNKQMEQVLDKFKGYGQKRI
jgi:L-fuculose-phosphate aldolase